MEEMASESFCFCSAVKRNTPCQQQISHEPEELYHVATLELTLLYREHEACAREVA